VKVFYDLHVAAYKTCCCPGTPAPYYTWLGIFYGAGEVLPCTSDTFGMLGAILMFGRCGGGW
jgi:hypothetical protein